MKHERENMSGDAAMQRFGINDIHDAITYRNFLSRKLKNTKSAQKLAEIYSQIKGLEFPGGITNAYVERLYPGHWQRSEGAWSWKLSSISFMWREDNIPAYIFGSEWTVRECLKNPDLITG